MLINLDHLIYSQRSRAFFGLLKSRIKSGSFVLQQSMNALYNMREINCTTKNNDLKFTEVYPDNVAVFLEKGSNVFMLIH